MVGGDGKCQVRMRVHFGFKMMIQKTLLTNYLQPGVTLRLTWANVSKHTFNHQKNPPKKKMTVQQKPDSSFYQK